MLLPLPRTGDHNTAVENGPRAVEGGPIDEGPEVASHWEAYQRETDGSRFGVGSVDRAL